MVRNALCVRVFVCVMGHVTANDWKKVMCLHVVAVL